MDEWEAALHERARLWVMLLRARQVELVWKRYDQNAEDGHTITHLFLEARLPGRTGRQRRLGRNGPVAYREDRRTELVLSVTGQALHVLSQLPSDEVNRC